MTPHRHRHTRVGKRGKQLKWLLIITIVAALIGAFLGLGGGLINFFEKNADVLDKQIIPQDIDRSAMEQLKKQYLQKR
ncbi:MAG: hypothetical protein Q7J31_19445 [Syntrophales bacterium]|nr:hypothetical protein [Syntrophales bacterium]